MEVHHHANHGGKESWKSYFWEFLMLFLAVFCGFLAEYQLEHVVEHKREKQFIQSFIEDLKIDTASINRNLLFQDMHTASCYGELAWIKDDHMQRIISFMHISLDGVVAGPNGEMDWIKCDQEVFDHVGKRIREGDTAVSLKQANFI